MTTKENQETLSGDARFARATINGDITAAILVLMRAWSRSAWVGDLAEIAMEGGPNRERLAETISRSTDGLVDALVRAGVLK